MNKLEEQTESIKYLAQLDGIEPLVLIAEHPFDQEMLIVYELHQQRSSTIPRIAWEDLPDTLEEALDEQSLMLLHLTRDIRTLPLQERKTRLQAKAN